MGPWKKFESTIVRLKRSYENTGSVVCLTTKGRQLERHFEELKPASHVTILGIILNLFDVFVAVFFSDKFFGSCGMKLRNYTSSLTKINFRQIIQ
jgi:hypothetical protein